MPSTDVFTSFNLVPQFNDNRCNPLFDPSSLKVNLVLDHECGSDIDTISVKDEAALVILDQTHDSKSYTILDALSYFDFSTTNAACGIESIILADGSTSFATATQSSGNFEIKFPKTNAINNKAM